MGTKNEPGKFDCHGKADDNEPLFTLRAKDPIAPQLVLIWKAIRCGEYQQADFHLRMAKQQWNAAVTHHHRTMLPPKSEKAVEAVKVASDMALWYNAKN